MVDNCVPLSSDNEPRVGDILVYVGCDCTTDEWAGISFEITSIEEDGDQATYQCRLLDPIPGHCRVGFTYSEWSLECFGGGDKCDPEQKWRVGYAHPLIVPQLTSVEEAQAWLTAHSR